MGCARIKGPEGPIHFKAGACLPDSPPCPDGPHGGRRGSCRGIHVTEDVTIEHPPELTFACGPGVDESWVCASCGQASTRLCDYPIGAGQTCSAGLCDDHAMKPGEAAWPMAPDELASKRGGKEVSRRRRQRETMADIDLCPVHWLEMQAKR